MSSDPSIEVVLETIRRKAVDLADHDLDEEIAVACARRDVAAAHGRGKQAEVWHASLEVFSEIRTMRHQALAELDDMTNPVQILRPLTREELDESGN